MKISLEYFFSFRFSNDLKKDFLEISERSVKQRELFFARLLLSCFRETEEGKEEIGMYDSCREGY